MLFVVFTMLQFLHAQNKNTPSTDTTKTQIDLEEIVVSSNNFTEKRKNIAQKIDVISAKTIASANTQNTGDLLINTGKIFVQKSQQGGSSPILRGFEASRILLVIDGVRMNNAIYRSGHLQNVITSDQNSLSRIEIMYGPSSTIYGSDALGGTIHLITKSPVLSGDKKFITTGTVFTRHSTSNDEKTIHADASIGSKKFAWFQGYNFSDFGDTKMGNNYPEKYPDFGRRSVYIGKVNGLDSILVNPDDRVQKYSGYKQWDITQKLLFKQNAKRSHLVNLQLSNSNNVPRYDRLQDTRNGTLRYAEWYYGPQKRLLGSYELNAENVGIADQLKANINYQVINESRFTREYKRYDRFDKRSEKIKVFGTTISARKITGNHETTIGMDVQLNDVKSTAATKNLLTGVVSKLDTRYPDGTNKMNYYGIYAQHVFKFSNKKLVLNDGLRIQAVRLKSNIKDNSFFHLPDTAVRQKYAVVTGNIGIVYFLNKTTIIKTSLASGFRAPNIDDLSKIFESSTAARQVVIPNAGLKPEYTYNIDLTVSKKFAEMVSMEFTGYYTLFRNAIVKGQFQLNGQDSIIYNGVKSQVLASKNANKATLYGFSVGLNAGPFKGFTFNSTLTYSYGRFKTDAAKPSLVYEEQPGDGYLLVQRFVSSKPLDHIPPVIAKATLSWQHKKFNSELSFLYYGWKRLDQFNADGEDNAEYATADGMPSWVIANIKGNLNIATHLQIQFGVENIFDRNYRYFASGFSAPGRNFIVALRANW